MSRIPMRVVRTLALVSAAVGCSDTATPPTDPRAALVSMEPQGGQSSVAVTTSPTLRFDRPLAQGMESFVVVHLGDLPGPEVDGVWIISIDRTTLTFDPAQPLQPATDYSVHMGAGMSAEDGSYMSLAQHGPTMGGVWATRAMMTGAMGMGGPTDTMMGAGWEHPTNGSFGMVFAFTTAG